MEDFDDWDAPVSIAKLKKGPQGASAMRRKGSSWTGRARASVSQTKKRIPSLPTFNFQKKGIVNGEEE